MKTSRGIAENLGIEKYVVAYIIKRRYFDESSIKTIKQLLHLEEESEYQIFESKINHE